MGATLAEVSCIERISCSNFGALSGLAEGKLYSNYVAPGSWLTSCQLLHGGKGCTHPNSVVAGYTLLFE